MMEKDTLIDDMIGNIFLAKIIVKNVKPCNIIKKGKSKVVCL